MNYLAGVRPLSDGRLHVVFTWTGPRVRQDPMPKQLKSAIFTVADALKLVDILESPACEYGFNYDRYADKPNVIRLLKALYHRKVIKAGTNIHIPEFWNASKYYVFYEELYRTGDFDVTTRGKMVAETLRTYLETTPSRSLQGGTHENPDPCSTR